jgi:hypothetical protein
MFDIFILVSDCLSIIQRILSPIHDRSLARVIVEDIKTLAAPLSSVTFRHVSRRRNNATHCLARRGESFGSVFFRDLVPEFIHNKLCIDII